MPTRAESFEIRVQQAVANLLRVDPARVKPEASLAGDLKVDSLEFMTIIVGLERAFGVELPDDEAARLRTIAQVTDALWRRAAPAQVAAVHEAALVSRSVE
jgi:acyl carrier protein